VHGRLGSLVGVVTALIDALEASTLDYAFGGAIALSAWAEPRATTDVDLNLWVDAPELGRGLDVLVAAGLQVDRRAAVHGARDTGLFSGRHGGYRVDVFVPSIPYYAEALASRRRVRLAERDTWVLSPESLAVFKLLFFRAKDLVDLQRLIEIQGAHLDVAHVRRHVAEMVGEDDARVAAWDRLVRADGP
jgi:hypothetical protein